MSPLLESLQAGFEALPPGLRAAGGLETARREALAATLRDGLPGPRAERWRYTALRAFERRRFVVADAGSDPDLQDCAALASIPAPRLVFVNGHFYAGLSQVEGLPSGVRLQPLSRQLATADARSSNFLARRFEQADEVFARLNAALAVDGAVLRADNDAVASAPIHLVFVGAPASADLAWHLRNLIELGEGARLSVVEHHLGAAAHAHFGNCFTHVHLRRGACLQHARLQEEAAGASLIMRSDAVLAAGSEYRRLDLELGAALSRHELNVALQGAGARLFGNGVLLADGARRLDTRVAVDHAVGDSACDLNWRGLGAAQGRAAFHGGILIRAGADGSDARLSNKNLLLSADAEIDTQPVLEIHAEEVRAAHGATVGQLDPGALFYLRSRGVPADEARRLLTVAFCREPLAAIVDSALAATLAAALDARLHAVGAL